MTTASQNETTSSAQTGSTPSPWNLSGKVDFVYLTFLVAMVVLVFGRTLTSYFLADDIGEIKYVNQILAGDWSMLWANFTGNYMQIPSMNVWRPSLLMSLLCDCAIWKGNASGYYLTNLVYFTLDVIAVYLVIRTLTPTWSRTRSQATAFAASALFAVSPLHAESISWIVGRVDAACFFFYLTGFLFFARSISRSRPSVIASVCGTAAFWIAITTKEMAVGLPVIVTTYGFLYSPGTSSRTQKLKQAMKFALPLWLSLVAYFALRYLALGTIFGGYTGSIGASQSANALSRWMDLDSWHRIAFPFPASVFAPGNIYESLLFGAYFLGLAIAGTRLLAGIRDTRLLAFCAVWAATALAPLYRLFGLGPDLEGARFLFFFTAPAAVAYSALLLSPDSRGSLPRSLNVKLSVLASCTLAAIAFVYCRSAQTTDILWIHAGKEVRAVLEGASKLAATLPEGKRAVLLGLPKEHGGAHMILNGDTFKMLLGKPFVESEIWDRFLTFEPVVFSPDPQIEPQRLRLELNSRANEGAFIWSSEAKRFVPVEPESANGSTETAMVSPVKISPAGQCAPYSSDRAIFQFTDRGLAASQIKDGDGIRIAGLNIDPGNWDYLEFKARYKAPQPVPFTASWCAVPGAFSKPVTARAGGSDGTSPVLVRIPLSRSWQWHRSARINEIRLLLPGVDSIEISDLAISRLDMVEPLLEVTGTRTPNGVVDLADRTIFSFKTSQIPDSATLEIEIGYPDFFFENMDQKESAIILKRINLPSPDAALELESADLPRPGFYQLRARALSLAGKPVSEFIQPITLRRQ